MQVIKSSIRRGHISLLIPLVLAVLILGGIVGLRVWYSHNLGPVSSITTTQYFTVSSGTSVHQIAANLEQAQLIRSAKAFETYVRGKGYSNKLQAGTYSLSPSMGVAKIAKKMVDGDVAKNLLTILPGKRLAEIKQAFQKTGYSQAAVDAAFDPAQYAGHPALASLPQGASLEGYLYPESFQKQADTPAASIVRKSLDEMQTHLTPDVTAGFAARGLSTFQGIILASIVLKETDNPSDQPIVAQVLLLRLARNMALQADATAFYAADVAGTPRSLSIDSPYNTYKHTELPPGPIANVTAGALQATSHPAGSDYLFYVTGDDGKTHFSHTQQEHEAAVQKYCKQRCAQ
jgi:peptidoglycan lytic transglycosylase G